MAIVYLKHPVHERLELFLLLLGEETLKGSVKVSGTKTSIESFLNRFLASLNSQTLEAGYRMD